MSDLVIADVSEYQGSIDWHAYVAAGYPVAIIRAHNGNRADNYWARNRAGAHAAGVQGLGIYQYVVAGRDAATQASELCDLIGTLQPGEWPICDLEEGSGDQSARAHAWYSTVAARLNDAAGEELYSGEYFFNAHQLAAAGFKRIWLAAYSSREPSEGHELWQFTDRRSFPGIPGTNDASVFHGTVDQLLTLINPQGVDMPLTDADVAKIWAAPLPDASLKPNPDGSHPSNPASSLVYYGQTRQNQLVSNQQAQAAQLAALTASVASIGTAVAAVATAVAKLGSADAALLADLQAAQTALAGIPAQVEAALKDGVVHVDVSVAGPAPSTPAAP